MIIVSACLAGINCRYDGNSEPDEEIMELVKAGEAIPVCPEELGGLPTPRPPMFFVDGTGDEVLNGTAKIVRYNGDDMTKKMLSGANAVLCIMHDLKLTKAILKSRSPSCGMGRVYVGDKLTAGNGVTTALILLNGFEVESRGDSGC